MWARLAPAEYVRVRPRRRRPTRRSTPSGALVDDDPPERPGRELVRDPRRRLRLRRPGARPRASSPSSTGTSTRDVPGWPEGPTHRDWMRPWVAADADSPTGSRPAGRPPGARDHGLRPSGRPPRVGQHRRPHPEHRRARPPRAPPRRPPARRRRSWSTCSRRSATAYEPEFGARRPRRRPRGDDGPPRRVDVPGRSRRARGSCASAGTCTRCSRMRHGFPLHRNLRPDLRLVPLQQARPAHPGRGRVPQALRPGRLPRLDHGPPADVDGRPGLLLRLPDDHDRRRVPRRSGAAEPTRRSPTWTCPDARPRGRRHATGTARSRSAGGRSSPTPSSPSTAWTPTGASTPGS